MKQIQDWLARQREKSKETRQREIAEGFQVREKGDTLCIVHYGDTIKDFPKNTTISEVIKELRSTRDTAIKYAHL